MPFGKHKGMLLKEIDRPYLEWGLANNIFKGRLKKLVEKIIN